MVCRWNQRRTGGEKTEFGFERTVLRRNRLYNHRRERPAIRTKAADACRRQKGEPHTQAARRLRDRPKIGSRARPVFYFRPDPRFFPPPDFLFTVAQARA